MLEGWGAGLVLLSIRRGRGNLEKISKISYQGGTFIWHSRVYIGVLLIT